MRFNAPPRPASSRSESPARFGTPKLGFGTSPHVTTKTRRDTTRHDESYVFNEVFGIARYAFVRGFRLVYTWEIYFILNLKNLQKLFLFFSILFKEESIQKNKIFLFQNSREILAGQRNIENIKAILDDGDFASVQPHPSLDIVLVLALHGDRFSKI